MNCITIHHLACDCREHKVAVLTKAALDAASQLDEMSSSVIGILNRPNIDQDMESRCKQIVERVYAAVEALGITIGVTDETPMTTEQEPA